MMKIIELLGHIAEREWDIEKDAFVALFRCNDNGTTCEIASVSDNGGHLQLNVVLDVEDLPLSQPDEVVMTEKGREEVRKIFEEVLARKKTT